MANFSALSAFFLILLAGIFSTSSAREFDVGGPQGWVNPGAVNLSESYNNWAKSNRFRVGDSVYFKYSNDSVLVVDRQDYHRCDTASPQHKFSDGNTTVRFDRHGLFYFISGEPHHCKLGQKLMIRVMHPLDEKEAPSPAPMIGVSSAVPPPSPNGAWKLADAGSYSVLVMATFAWAALFFTMFWETI